MKYEPTENDIKKQVKDWLMYHGWFVFYLLQGLGSFRGVPDLIAIKDGHVLFIECKREKNRLSRDQEKFKDQIEKHGGIYITAHGIGEVLETVYNLEKE